MGDLSPAAQSFVGPTVLGVIALMVWGIRSGWFARNVWRDQRRKERLEESTDEFTIAQQDDKVIDLREQRDKKIADVWRAEFKEAEIRHEQKRKEDLAEYNHRLVGYQTELSNARAEIKMLKDENVKCNQVSVAQAVEIGGLRVDLGGLKDRINLILDALDHKGIDLGLEWMRPHVQHPTTVTTTTVIQTEQQSQTSLPPPQEDKL